MANVASYQKPLTTGLTPLLSRLSAGTEMASYGDAQWNFLLGGGDVTAFVVPDDEDKDTHDKLLGCLLRIELNAPSVSMSASEEDRISSRAAGFGMMLVSPDARGKGFAKSLLNEAISADGTTTTNNTPTNDTNKSSTLPVRKLLAVCSELGQPVYRKLGFSNVGRVTALSTEIAAAREIPLDNECGDDKIRVQTFGSMEDDNNEEAIIDSDIRNLLVNMDVKATGYDRTERLSFMLKNDRSVANGVRTIAATAIVVDDNEGNDEYNDNVYAVNDTVVAAAIIRQEQPGGPFVIGPMMGSEKAVLPLIRALARSVPDHDDGAKVSILVSDHLDLVDRLKSVAKFEQGFDFPAMALDGKSIYYNGDGSYLSLIHPTLG